VCALALLDAPLALVGAAAAAAGALMPPIGASLRSLWPRMFADAELRAAAYALEASLQEITFIVGPLLVALLTAAVSPVLALGVAAVLGGVGTMLIIPINKFLATRITDQAVLTERMERWMFLNNIRWVTETAAWVVMAYYFVAKGRLASRIEEDMAR